MSWALHVTPIGENRNIYRVLMRKFQGKETEKPRHKLESKIKTDLKEIA
jgi:hypothetical protein